jgi:Protein kinase domain/WD40-like Beta Propeller Repeat
MKLDAASGLDNSGELTPGARLGPYAITAPLGAGGMGEVYRATDTRLGREVAIKVLSRPASFDPSRRLRFDREARLASAVSHPHVLTVFDVGEWEDLPYVVTELLEGETLRVHLRPGVLAARQAVGFAVQVAHGLAALHARGIVHRDLKPENLFVTSDGRVKILDLGLAAPSRDAEAAATEPWETLTTEGAAVGGTAAYMSPEQVRRLPADPKSDIFACGVVLYEMLGRRRPFQEETAAETMTAILRRDPSPLATLEPSLPPALVRVVERCLAKRPDDRFHSAHDLALALESALDPTPDPPPRPSISMAKEAAPGSLGRAARLVILALVIGGGTWFWKASSAPVAVTPVLANGPAVLVGYDPKQGQFVPFLQGIAAEGVDFSRDAEWATFTTYPAAVLWRSRADGRDRLPLTKSPLRAGLPRFSPDGRRIAFAARLKDGPWQIHIVSVNGGGEATLPPLNVTDPGWEPDGQTLVFGPAAGGQAGISRWDLASGRTTLVPGSEALYSPRPSPDGRFLAAVRHDSGQLVALDAQTGQWSSLTKDAATYPAWTRDGQWLSFRRSGPGAGFYRTDPRSHREERVTTIDEAALAAGAEWGAWSGLTPDGLPLALFDLRVKGMAFGRSSSGRYEPTL